MNFDLHSVAFAAYSV